MAKLKLLALHLLSQAPGQASRLLLAAHGLPEIPDFASIAQALDDVEGLSASARQAAQRRLQANFAQGVAIPPTIPLSAYSQIASGLFRLAPGGHRMSFQGLGMRGLSVLVSHLPEENAALMRASLLPAIRAQLQNLPAKGRDLLIPAGLLWHCMSRHQLDYHDALRLLGEPLPELGWPQMTHELCWHLGLLSP